MKHTVHTLSKVWNWCLEAVFPSRCVGCGVLGSFLCDTCLSAIPPAEPHADTSIRAAWSYRHTTVHRLIWHLKYDGIKAIAPVCATAIADMITEDLAERRLTGTSSPALVVATPMGPQHLKERGYNQAECIATSLVTRIPTGMLIHIPSVLVKTRDTAPQMSLPDRKTRLSNLKGLFVVTHPEVVRGKNIILIDDVVTTGATLNEARSALLEAGATNVCAYVVAH